MSEAGISSVLSRFREDGRPRGGRPPNPGRQLLKTNKLAWRNLERAMRVLIELMSDTSVTPSLRAECAKEIVDRCMGRTRVQIEADITSKSLIITPAELAAEIAQLAQSLAVLPGADTVKQLPEPAVPEEPEDLPF